MNKTIIDYSNKFGNNYKKLILTNIRKKNTLEEVDVKTFNISNNIILPTLFNDIKEFDNINNNCDFSKNPNIEGIIILLKKNNKDYIIKLQSSLYQFYKISGNKSNLYKGYIDLYQNLEQLYKINNDYLFLKLFLIVILLIVRFVLDNNHHRPCIKLCHFWQILHTSCVYVQWEEDVLLPYECIEFLSHFRLNLLDFLRRRQ